MRIRKNSSKYPSKYVFIKNDKLAYLAGLMLLLVTALATLLGVAPQDVEQFSHTWWYELVINIVSIVVLIGLVLCYLRSDDANSNMGLLLIGPNGI